MFQNVVFDFAIPDSEADLQVRRRGVSVLVGAAVVRT